MAIIHQPSVSVHYRGRVAPNSHRFEVKYRLLFNDNELQRVFEEAAKLWESDDGSPTGGDDEAVTAYQRPPRRFMVTSTIMDRTFEIDAPDDAVDTELGNEEIYAQIWLRQVGKGPADSEVTTGPIEIDA